MSAAFRTASPNIGCCLLSKKEVTHHVLSAFKKEVRRHVRLLMTDRLNTEPNSHGDVVFTPPELEFEQTPGECALNHANVLAMMHNNDGVVRIDVVDGGNEDSARLDPQHASPTSELLPANLVDDGNRHNSQLEGDHANCSYGIYKLLNIYAVSQAGILAVASSTRRRMEGVYSCSLGL